MTSSQLPTGPPAGPGDASSQAPASGLLTTAFSATSRSDWEKRYYQSITILATLALIAIGVWLLSHVALLVVLVVLALLLTVALDPVVSWMERYLPRAIAVLICYLVLAGILVLLAVVVVRPVLIQAAAFIRDLPRFLNHAYALGQRLGTDLGANLPDLGVNPQSSGLLGGLGSALQNILGSAIRVVPNLLSFVFDGFIVLFIAFWFLVDGRRLRASVLERIPEQSRTKVEFVAQALTRVLSGYIRGQLLMALIIGLSAWIGCAVLGVPYAAVLGFLAFLAELVPMLGPILAAVPALLVAAFQPFPLVIWVLIYFIVMMQVENNLLVPRIAGHAVGVHPVVAMLALLTGAEVAGIAGALVAVPLVGTASVLIDAFLKSSRGEAVVVHQGGMTFAMEEEAAPPAAGGRQV